MTLNLAQGLRESAKVFPKKAAIAIGETTIDYATLHSYVQRFAGGLRSLGIKRGQHIALMLPNVPQFTIAYYGAHYNGSPVVPMNVLLTADEIAYHLNDSDAVALVVWEGFFEQAHAGFARSDRCKHLIVAKADRNDFTAPETVINMTALIGTSEPMLDLAPTMPDEAAVLLYTSGTTGRSKGAELSHFNMFYNYQYMANQLFGANDSLVSLAVLPLFHSFGQTVVQNVTLAVGGTMVLLPRFDPESAFQLMSKYQVNLFAGVPTMYFALLHHSNADAYDLKCLKLCVSGGSPMPVEVMKAFDTKYGVNILEGYGLSETSPVASFNVLHLPKKAGSIGIPIWGVEFRLIDNEGVIVTSPGERGEICIKGHNVMRGYYNKPEETAIAVVDGWFHTGDIAHYDEDGYYYIVDRKKDMIIRGGYNVYPREIEEVLYGHPTVAEAAVIGVPHERHGEEVKAIVALKPGKTCTESELIDYCKEHLAAYKYPRTIEFMDSLPKGPTGKILKRELRAS
jgi:long-chain acyl-CoA synthetase